ncbi:hypothetical protein IB643_02110 [Allofrancisella guangzhouensis]|uniref:hypothetical protein n=1 Tax=Allofrancisella guangzhouensis TaxID=594679 RepID=UPI000A545891|nr:hypothetical protein [Allofrancisella guangzhouensis]MBK2026952.1 hypothetical protein [Allofrancisella guangzhouensis]MBK2045160.1 hypothetical protein [Allofrancisella guangzhouensis]
MCSKKLREIYLAINQIEMISLNDLVARNHTYRKFVSTWNFSNVAKKLKRFEKDKFF